MMSQRVKVRLQVFFLKLVTNTTIQVLATPTKMTWFLSPLKHGGFIKASNLESGVLNRGLNPNMMFSLHWEYRMKYKDRYQLVQNGPFKDTLAGYCWSWFVRGPPFIPIVWMSDVWVALYCLKGKEKKII